MHIAHYLYLQVWKEGMKVEAFYKKRKQLSEYLPPSERHKLKVVKSSNVNSPARTLVDKSNENSLAEAPIAASVTPTGGKRRTSDPDSEADMSVDNSKMNCEVANGEAQPPMKRSNTSSQVTASAASTTTNNTSAGSTTAAITTNGSNGGLEVS